MMRVWGLALVVASGAAWGQIIQAPGTPATEPYTDTASGLVFPVSAGAFQRVRLARGADLSAGYLHDASAERVAATVLVNKPSDADGACAKMAIADRAAVAKRGGAFFDLVPAPVAGWETAGFGGNGAGTMGGQEHYYYCQGGWAIQFSFQHSPDLDAEALETAFLAGFPLPQKQ